MQIVAYIIKKKPYRLSILLLSLMGFFICFANQAAAQRHEIGVTFGGSSYMGDLNPKRPLTLLNPGAGVLYRQNFNYHWSVRGNIYYMRVEGSDAIIGYNPTRDLSFFSDIYEFSVQTEVNFLQYQPGNLNTPFTPYIFAGLGGFLFHPKRLLPDGQIINLFDPAQNQERETNYNVVSHHLLFGMGFKFNLTRFLSTGMEWGMRMTGTDYLDDVSRRGNPKNNDWYSYIGLIITFKINDPSRAICPYPN